MVSSFVPVVSWNRPVGSLDSDGGFKIAFSCVRVPPNLQNITKMNQNDQKHFQYYAMNIASNTVLTTLWTQAQTHLRVPLPEFIQRPRAPKQFLWAAG